MDYLQLHPYQANGKRGPKTRFNVEVRRERYLILRKKAALEQRKRKLKTGYPDNLLILARIDSQIARLTEEIEGKGGIPPKWLVVKEAQCQ